MDHFEAPGSSAALPCVPDLVALQHDVVAARRWAEFRPNRRIAPRTAQGSSAEEHHLHCLVLSHGANLATGLRGPARRGAAGATSRGFSGHSGALSTDGEV